jgi:hypothetical protein
MRRALVGALVLAVAACGGGGGGAAQPNTGSRPIRGPADFISEAEINASVYQNALEIVQNLRPNMTRPRGSTSQGPVPVVLYMDDVRLGELNGLATIPANRVKEIRYINARDATTRWGTGHGSGVILVTTKR